MAIPPSIHQIWINPDDAGPTGLPRRVARQCRRWEELHPGVTRCIWSQSDVVRMGNALAGDRFEAALMSLRFPAARADLGRLAVLLHLGGFWADLKLVPQRRFLDGLMGHDLVLVEHVATPELPDPTDFLMNGFIGAAPGHPFIMRVLEQALFNVEQRNSMSVFELTGPSVYMNIRRAMLLESGTLGGDWVIERSAGFWGHCVTSGSNSYNRRGRHWASRQQVESTFVDDQPT